MNKEKILSIFANRYIIFILPTFTFLLMQVGSFQDVIVNNFKFAIILGVFYFYLGFECVKFLAPRLFHTNSTQSTLLQFNLFQILAFSGLAGICINSLFGIPALFFNVYSSPYYYIFYIEILALTIRILENFGNPQTIPKLQCIITKSDVQILLLLLLPTLFRIYYEYHYSPYPLAAGWDLFFYQGNTRLFLLGQPYYYYAFGFSVLGANLLVASNVEFSFIIEFYKLGHILTIEIITLWLYLIIHRLTNLKLIALVGALFLSSFDGISALGPRYFHPSTFVFQIGLGMLYLMFLYLPLTREKMSDPPHTPKVKLPIQKSSLFWIIFAILSLSSFLIHKFIFFLFLLCFLFIGVVSSPFFKKHLWLLYPTFILDFLGILVGWTVSTPLLEVFSKMIFGNWLTPSFENQFNLLTSTTPPILLIFCVVYATYTLLKKKREWMWVPLVFLGALLLYFAPIYYMYRIEYLLVIFETLTFSLFLRDLRTYYLGHTTRAQDSAKNNLPIAKYSYFTLISLMLFSVMLLPLFRPPILSQEALYSAEEFEAFSWIRNNCKVKRTLSISDPGLAWFVFGFSGIMQTYNSPRSILRNCPSTGLSLTDLSGIIYPQAGTDYLLILSPRTHRWIRTDSEIEAGPVGPGWINYTLLQYIELTPGIRRIFNNSNTYIFSIDFT